MDVDPVTAFDKAFALGARVAELMGSALAERGLTASRAEVVLALDGSGPLIQKELGRILRCSARHVTTLVDALEAGGFVERRPHPSDRRATLVVLTDQGTAAAARMEAERRDAAHAVLGGVSCADLDAFVRVADHLLATLGPGGVGAAGVIRDRTG